jgi:hypothetical protein
VEQMVVVGMMTIIDMDIKAKVKVNLLDKPMHAVMVSASDVNCQNIANQIQSGSLNKNGGNGSKLLYRLTNVEMEKMRLKLIAKTWLSNIRDEQRDNK